MTKKDTNEDVHVVEVDVSRFRVLFKAVRKFMADMDSRPEYYAEDPRAILLTAEMLTEAAGVLVELHEEFHLEDEDENEVTLETGPTRH